MGVGARGEGDRGLGWPTVDFFISFFISKFFFLSFFLHVSYSKFMNKCMFFSKY